MNAFTLAGFCIAAAMVVLLLRQFKPEYGTVAALAAGTLLVALSLPWLTQVVDGINRLGEAGGLKGDFLAQLMKVAGVSLLMDFAAQTCRDAGENGLALRAELAGRLMLLALSLPVMQSLLGQFMSLCA